MVTNGAEQAAPQQQVDLSDIGFTDRLPSSRHDHEDTPKPISGTDSTVTSPADARQAKSVPEIKKCAVCQKPARYCCPKCSLRTCSLGCVQAHKKQTGCDGVRDRAAFIALNKFSDLDLLSDYRFLEEAARTIDNAVRDNVVKSHRRESLPQHLSNMQKFAWGKLRVSLQFLPQMFSRRRLNRTSIKKSHFLWTLEVQLPQSELTVIKHEISSSTTIKDIVIKVLSDLTPQEREKAAALTNASIGEISVLMKAVGRPANNECYFEFDTDLSLEDNLRGKTLVEFPTLIVVTRDHRGAFPVKDVEQSSQAAKPTDLPSFFVEGDGSDGDDNEQRDVQSGNFRKKQRHF